MGLSLDEDRRRNVFTLGVSVTMLPTRSCPRQFAVTGDAEVASETAGDVTGEAGEPPATGEAGDLSAAFAASPPGTGTADDPSGGGAGAAGVPAAGVVGELGAAGGGAPPGGGDPESESRRPKRAAARRILKKYMATIASANAMSSTIVKR